MEVDLSRHYGRRGLVKVVIPSVLMMLVTSIYSIVDGLFVSNYAGTTPFAAINLIWPGIMFVGALGIMIGTGGTALVAKTKGEGDDDHANRIFSMLVKVTVVGGLVLSVLLFVLMRPLARLLGADGALEDECVRYGRILAVSFMPFLVQLVFQTFFMAAEKPELGTKVTIASGLINMVLDYVFIALLGWGIVGAAAATAIAQIAGGAYPLYYFSSKRNDSSLRLVPCHVEWRNLGVACLNGSSEYVGNIAFSVVNMCYNLQLVNHMGENGVAAYGVLMYVAYIFAAIFFGYNIGVSPIISYHYGAGNKAELHSLLTKSLQIVAALGVLLTLTAELTGRFTSAIFVHYDKELLELTVRAYRIYMISFALCGMNLFVSAFFTALNNGVVSAIAAFTRTLIFEVGAVFLLPALWGIDVIWWSVVLADVMAFILSICLLKGFRKRYGY